MGRLSYWLSRWLARPRTKLLYYFYRRREVPEDFSKSKLARLAGYRSDGHFYREFDRLLEEGLIVHDRERGVYRITEDGEAELFPILLPKYFVACLVGAGLAIICLSISEMHGLRVGPEYYAVVGVLLVAFGALVWTVVKLLIERKLRP